MSRRVRAARADPIRRAGDASTEPENDGSELPEGWASVPLRELSRPSRARRDPQEHKDLPYVGMEQVESHTRRLLGTLPSPEMKSTAFHFQKRDVLYGRLRPYLNKVWRAEFEGLCSSEFIVLPPNDAFEPGYLACFLSTDEFVAFANHLNQGDRPRVSFEQIGEYRIPLPPLAEQRRIVAKLEELLGKVSSSQQRLARVLGLLKRFRQSVLAAACSGRLTADWREENPEPASAVSATQGTGDGIPQGWTIATVGDVIDSLKYGTSKKCDYSQTGVPVLRIPNIGDGVIDQSDLKYAELESPEFDQLRLRKGDLLLIRSNGTVSLVGKTALVRDSEKDLAYAGYLIRLRPDRTKITPEFLNAVLGSYDVRLQIEIPARSTSGVNNINSDEVRALKIPLPPLAEQREIVRRVERLFGFADQIEARLTHAQTHVARLTQSLLAQAFRGELVPTEAALARRNGCDYEPASTLLARIRTEQAALDRNHSHRTASANDPKSRKTSLKRRS